MIADALREVGAGRSIVIDGDNIIRAGNGVYEAAAEAGFERVRVIDVAGDELIAVRRRDWTPAQAERYGLYDNRSTDLSAFDDDVLRQFAQEGALAGMWSDADIAALLSETPIAGGDDPGADVERAAALRAQWDVAPGDLWAIPSLAAPGEAHFIVCGDATEAGVVTAATDNGLVDLIVTDPPYGVDYVGKTKAALKLRSDNLGNDGTRALLRDALTIAPLKPGGSFYVCSTSGEKELQMRLALEEADLPLRQELVWIKQQFVMGHADYHYRHESILYGWKPGGRHFFIARRDVDTIALDESDAAGLYDFDGAAPAPELERDALEYLLECYRLRVAGSVWRIDRPSASVDHPTMKPVELFERCIAYSSTAGQRVYDPFLGSGTTLVAAERYGRLGSAVDIDPQYVAVALERLAGMGLHPERIERGTPSA